MDLTITPVMPAKKPSQNAFGQRLVALRQARGLTQVQLAKVTGMTQRAISYYEIEKPSSHPLRHSSRSPSLLRSPTTSCSAYSLPRLQDTRLSNKQRLWKRFQKMEVLPTKDQRAVIRLIYSLAGSAHAEAS